MMTLRNLLVSLLVGAGIFTASGIVGQTPQTYLQYTSFDFGVVRQGALVQHAFSVKNSSSLPLRVRILGMSLPGMTARVPPEIPAREARNITVSWNTRVVQGPVKGQVLVRFNDTENVTLELSVKVIPPIDVLPYPAVFISAFRDEKIARVLEIVNNVTEPIKVLSVATEGAPSTYTATFDTIEEGRRYRLTVASVPGVPSGRSQHLLRVLTDHSEFPELRLPVHLLVKDDVYFNPESLDFGEVTMSGGQEQTFLLKKRHGPLRIISATSDLPFLSIRHEPTDAGSTHQFSISLKPDNLIAGPISGTIHVRTDDPQFSELKVPVGGFVRGQ